MLVTSPSRFELDPKRMFKLVSTSSGAASYLTKLAIMQCCTDENGSSVVARRKTTLSCRCEGHAILLGPRVINHSGRLWPLIAEREISILSWRLWTQQCGFLKA